MENMEVVKTEEKKPDIFDRIMSLGFLKKFEPLYKKNKQILLYIFFGGLTTVISFGSFFILSAFIDIPSIELFGKSIDMSLTVVNVISWICAVTFSYITSRIWVFESHSEGKKAIFKEAMSFCGGRVFTLVIETIMLNVGVNTFSINKNLMKILATIVVLILNYIISKMLVFKKTSETTSEA